MDPEDEYRLSFYTDIGPLDKDEEIRLVRHKDTGNIYVRKDLSDYDFSVFLTLLRNDFTGIPEIEDLAEDEDSHKLTVIEEYINGSTLRSIMDSEGTFPEARVIQILSAICDVLEPLHSHTPPIIHRDIKPENILITNDSNLYLVDFDASKVYSEGKTRDTELIGTRRYAAPEQYGYFQSDPRTDIYAVGKVGIELITGDPNNKAGQISAPLRKILDRCTDMDPDDRFRSVRELRDALRSVGKVIPVSRYSRYALPGFRSDKLWLKVIAAVLYAALFGMIWFYPITEISFVAATLGRICSTLQFITLILFYGNYMSCHDHIPLMKSKSRFVRYTGYVIYTYVIVYGIRIIFALLGLPNEY